MDDAFAAVEGELYRSAVNQLGFNVTFINKFKYWVLQ